MTAATSSGEAVRLPPGNVGGELGFLLVGGPDTDVGVDRARGDGVDGDAGVGDFAGQGLGETEDGGLGRGVGHLAEDTAAALGRH